MYKKWLGIIIFFIAAIIITACQRINDVSQINDTKKGEFAGVSCVTPKKGSGVVVGYFSGYEQTQFQNRGTGIMPISRYRCFKSTESCETWIDVMSNLYNAKGIEKRVCKQY